MLKDALYTTTSFEHKEDSIAAVFEVNANHPIFLGHFPHQPVLPGACTLQIVKELLEHAFEKPIRLKIAEQLKFLKAVDPFVNKMLTLKVSYKIEDPSLFVSATIYNGNELVFKLKGTFLFL